ncbi:hypothetical protein [Siphonobacter curvatus]|uniref:hypothetical protein n=1 Tax=Siphonobacter curvatus TaxID=2094562 RepID=UPI0010570C0E|nr:hypothetical protein [Siphonobacter curvatus]
MKKVPLLVGAFLLLVLWSCKKDQDESIPFPRYLVMDYVKAKTPIRLFTAGKEITDQSIISAFLKDSTYTGFERYTKHASYFGYEKSPITADTLITFTHSDSVVVGKFDVYSNPRRSVVRKGKELVIISPIYAIRLSNSPINEIVKHNLIIEDYMHLPNEVRLYKVREVYAAYGDYNQLEMPRISYFYKRGNRGNSLSTLNEFDESYITKVAKGDTLVVQEYLLGLKAK